MKKKIQARIDDADKIQKLCEKKGITLSQLLRQLIAAWLKKVDKK